MAGVATIASLPTEQLVSWGFSSYRIADGMAPDRFLEAVGSPPVESFRNVEFVLEGMAITDVAIDYWLNEAFFGFTPDFPPIAVDTRLLSFIASKWYPRINDDLTITELLAKTSPTPTITSAIAYGHDRWIKVYDLYLTAVDEAVARAQAEGITGYVVISSLELFRIMEVYVGLHRLRQDATESVNMGTPTGEVESFARDVAELSHKRSRGSALGWAALAFAGLGAGAMFALIMAGGVKR